MIALPSRSVGETSHEVLEDLRKTCEEHWFVGPQLALEARKYGDCAKKLDDWLLRRPEQRYRRSSTRNNTEQTKKQIQKQNNASRFTGTGRDEKSLFHLLELYDGLGHVSFFIASSNVRFEDMQALVLEKHKHRLLSAQKAWESHTKCDESRPGP